MATFKDKVADLKKNDPQFKKAYDDLEEEFQMYEELILARKRSGLTQQQIAEKMGSKREAVSRLESGGKHSPSIRTLRNYARALGCKLQVKMIPV